MYRNVPHASPVLTEEAQVLGSCHVKDPAGPSKTCYWLKQMVTGSTLFPTQKKHNVSCRSSLCQALSLSLSTCFRL